MEKSSGPVVNFVSKIPQVVLERQEPSSSFVSHYSTAPLPADWHVLIDYTDQAFIPNSRARCMFVALEPPEIRKYDLDALAAFGCVLSADFKYLSRLNNVSVTSGLLPWRVGLGIESEKVRVNMDFDDLLHAATPSQHVVSVVTSDKALTSAQRQRLRLVEYLDSRLPEMQIYGRGFDLLDDKADALIASKYHLALENCFQRHFWTEKLSDPIMMRNVTFYSGRNAWQADFSGSPAIVEVDIYAKRRTYEVIRKTLDQDVYESCSSELEANRLAVMRSMNLHSVVFRKILALGDRPTRQGGEYVHIPQHRRFRDRMFSQLSPRSD